jgi:hypothetical protein
LGSHSTQVSPHSGRVATEAGVPLRNNENCGVFIAALPSTNL